VVMVNPVGALGQPVSDAIVRTALAAAFEGDRNLGSPDRIRLVRRGLRDPLPIE